MKWSWQVSLTSQLVLLIAVSIVIMQLYKFFLSWEILDLFNTLASMVLGAYFQRQVNKTDLPPKPVDEPQWLFE